MSDHRSLQKTENAPVASTAVLANTKDCDQFNPFTPKSDQPLIHFFLNDQENLYYELGSERVNNTSSAGAVYLAPELNKSYSTVGTDTTFLAKVFFKGGLK